MAFEYERQREKDVVKKKQEAQERMAIIEKAKEEQEVGERVGSLKQQSSASPLKQGIVSRP